MIFIGYNTKEQCLKKWGGGSYRTLKIVIITHFLRMVIQLSLFGISGLARIIITFRDGCCLRCCSCGKHMNECLMEHLLVCTRSKVGICISCSSWLFLLLFGITFVVIDMICLLLVMDEAGWIALSAIPVFLCPCHPCCLASWASRVGRCTIQALTVDFGCSLWLPKRSSARHFLRALPIWDWWTLLENPE